MADDAVSGNLQVWPEWLASANALRVHLSNELLPDDPSFLRGRLFLDFAFQCLKQFPELSRWTRFEKNVRESHDGGVDIFGFEDDGRQTLLVQSRYHLDRITELDAIFSAFSAWESRVDEGQLQLDWSAESALDKPFFAVVTADSLSSLVKKYRTSRKASVDYFKTLENEGRIYFLDAERILAALRGAFRRAFDLPARIEIRSPAGWISIGNVHMGVIDGSQLSQLYRKHGEGLFFENIRSFLGLEGQDNRESVNRRIVHTARSEPSLMLERNNGLTFRADGVRLGSMNELVLSGASIVNGCQTTVCIALAGGANPEILVPVKIVESADSWDVAHSANYQNRVKQVDLDIARYLRPLVVQRAAAVQGVSVAGVASASEFVSGLGRRRATYDECRSLFIGLFSSPPQNVLSNNYNRMRMDAIERAYATDEQARPVFSAIFHLADASRSARVVAESLYGSDVEFRRYKRLANPEYHALLTILAAAGMVGTDISSRDADPEIEARRMLAFLAEVEVRLAGNERGLERHYLAALEVVGDMVADLIDDRGGATAISAAMRRKIEQMSFSASYVRMAQKLRLEEKRRELG